MPKPQVDRLPDGCKMLSHSRYASDDDCTNCGLGEGEACATYHAIADASIAAKRAAHRQKPQVESPTSKFPESEETQRAWRDLQATFGSDWNDQTAAIAEYVACRVHDAEERFEKRFRALESKGAGKP